MFFYRLFVLLLFALESSTALKCYSCGEENIYLGHDFRTPLPCDEMDTAPDLEQFIIECPENFLGCTTQFKENEITRTCDTVPSIDDCKTANGITYCYCSQDLCNGKQSHADAHKASRDLLTNGGISNYPSDDEDYAEMSGRGPVSEEEEDEEGSEENDISNYSNRASSRLSSNLVWIVLVISLNSFIFNVFFVSK